VLGLVCIQRGIEAWQLQHSGTPAQVVVQRKCDHRECFGGWRQSDGTEKTVQIYGTPKDLGTTLDVHIHGDIAYTNDTLNWMPPILIGCACLIGSAVTMIVLIVGARRRRAGWASGRGVI
jgi:hypothetical protein